MTSCIDVATPDDLSAIIASADALVASDAGRYDPAGTDLAWAARSGSAYVTGLLGSSDNLVLLARDGDPVIGHLVARLSGRGGSTRTRPTAVLSGSMPGTGSSPGGSSWTGIFPVPRHPSPELTCP